MKHLPNILTLGNLFCGCLAIAYLLTSQPYLFHNYADGSFRWVMGTEQIYFGTIFITLAAIFDMLDGFAARALNVHSPIGKDLDSLADVVSFGVAPSMVMFKCLWDAAMHEVNALDVNMLTLAPAFLIACFGALRLARFNITSNEQKAYFIGMPIPAVGLFIGTFPLFIWNNSLYITKLLQNKWMLYAIIGLMCFFMVSKIKFIKFLPPKISMQTFWPQIVIIIGTLGSMIFIKSAAILVAFVLYVLLSLVYKYPETKTETNKQ